MVSWEWSLGDGVSGSVQKEVRVAVIIYRCDEEVFVL